MSANSLHRDRPRARKRASKTERLTQGHGIQECTMRNSYDRCRTSSMAHDTPADGVTCQSRTEFSPRSLPPANIPLPGQRSPWTWQRCSIEERSHDVQGRQQAQSRSSPAVEADGLVCPEQELGYSPPPWEEEGPPACGRTRS